MTKIRDKYPDRNPYQARINRSKTLPKSQISHRTEKKEVGSPTKRLSGETFEKECEETQAGHTPKPLDNTKPRTGIERASREGRYIKSTRNKRS